jgi:hypothetical protein
MNSVLFFVRAGAPVPAIAALPGRGAEALKTSRASTDGANKWETVALTVRTRF